MRCHKWEDFYYKWRSLRLVMRTSLRIVLIVNVQYRPSTNSPKVYGRDMLSMHAHCVEVYWASEMIQGLDYNMSICSAHQVPQAGCAACAVDTDEINEAIEALHLKTTRCFKCGFEYYTTVNCCPKCGTSRISPEPPLPKTNPNGPIGPNYPWWVVPAILAFCASIIPLILWIITIRGHWWDLKISIQMKGFMATHCGGSLLSSLLGR